MVLATYWVISENIHTIPRTDFWDPAGNSKGLDEKIKKIQTGGGVNDYGIPRAWGDNTFWNF